ncbi:MAG: sulfotransferase [Crocinitomicaceae bacterium]|nr:sulfotransferase [Crocinitomicaceae bacterium]
MKRPILVTGSHRSGSTWVGKIISESKDVQYIHEPFNKDITRFNAPFKEQLKYVSEHSTENEQKNVEKYMNSFSRFPSRIAFSRFLNTKSVYDLYFNLWDVGDLNRRFLKRPLFKDPIALLSAEWLYQKYNCDVVIIIRHPAAFVASLSVKNWKFDFNNLLDQKTLKQSCIGKYWDDIEKYAKDQPNLIHQGILLWNILYSMIHDYQKKYGDNWIFVRHEDLSLSPTKEFKKIFATLNLDFTSRVKKTIIASSTATNENDSMRDSAKNIKTWKNRLTDEEITRVKEGTREVWTYFYDESDWE